MTHRWADLVDERLARRPVDPWPDAPLVRPKWTFPTMPWPEVRGAR